jgi:hypothetical protein
MTKFVNKKIQPHINRADTGESGELSTRKLGRDSVSNERSSGLRNESEFRTGDSTKTMIDKRLRHIQDSLRNISRNSLDAIIEEQNPMPQDPVKFLEAEAMLGLLDNLNISRVFHSSL